MNSKESLRTDYFNQPWTWYKKIGYFLIFILFATAWEISEDPWDYWWIKYAILIFFSLGLFLSPIDDIAVDDQFFYHIRRSLLKSRNRVIKYDLSTIQSIRCLGIHVKGFSVHELAGTNHQVSNETNTLEISFKDGTSISLELAIYKKELIFYAEQVRKRNECLNLNFHSSTLV